MGPLEHNCGNISSLIAGKMLNFGMEAFFILFFLNITIKLVISQIQFLWRHHFGTLYLIVALRYKVFFSRVKKCSTVCGHVTFRLLYKHQWIRQRNRCQRPCIERAFFICNYSNSVIFRHVWTYIFPFKN